MHSAYQRAGGLLSFFVSCIFVVLPLIGVFNLFMRRGVAPQVSVVVDNVSSRLGVEDYFMNRKVMLTDLVFNLDAGKTRNGRRQR